MDTIFALSTPPGRGGVAVVRVSGRGASRVLGAFGIGDVQARQASLRRLSIGGEVIDTAVVLLFDRGRSFTGETVIELQLHGSPAVVRRVLRELSALDGFRQAEAGEFTRRALENNRMDLAEVEGLGALIEAETEAQRVQAQRLFDGALGQACEVWRSDLLRAAALLEATIDFADEEVPVDVVPEVSLLLGRVSERLAREIRGSEVAERIREGFEVAIVGAPNVGKSTLLNALAGRKAALTSEVAGTTRDVIEVRMDLGGLPVTLLDTAGLRDTEDAVERMGVGLAVERARGADLRIFLESGESSPVSVEWRPGDIRVRGKADLDSTGEVSGITGQGIDRLLGDVSGVLAERVHVAGVATHERHRTQMRRAEEALESARNVLEVSPESAELVAENVRSAVRSLDGLIGRIDVETVLGEIFSRFCIGK